MASDSMIRSMASGEGAIPATEPAAAPPPPHPQRRLRVALIMPVRNEEKVVRRTLGSVFASTRLPDEIVISDGLSTDRTLAEIERYRDQGVPLKIISNPAIYAGAGRNAAVLACASDLLVFCDFGNEIDPRWIESMVAPLESDAMVDIVAGLWTPRHETDFERCVGTINYAECFNQLPTSETERQAALEGSDDLCTFNVGGGNMACRRSIWKRLDGFPDWLRAAEDKLLSRKARNLGLKVVVNRRAGVLHHMRSTPAQVFRQLYLYHQGDGRTAYVSEHFLKLVLVYGIVLALAALAPLSPWFGGMALMLFGLYVYRTGIQKIVAVDGRVRRPIHVAYALAIVLMRDLGVLLGQFAGWRDWLLRPVYRRRFSAYFTDRDDDRKRQRACLPS